MRYFLEDFIEASNRCHSVEELFHLYQKFIAQLGFDGAVYTFINDHTSIGQKAGHGVQFSYPEHWMNYYLEKSYQKIDPVITQMFQSRQAFTWKKLIVEQDLTETQRTMFMQAKESGLVEGVGVPLHGPNGETAGVGLSSQHSDIYNGQDLLPLVQLLTSQFHLVYCQLLSNQLLTVHMLSNRELEVLKWWAIGKTQTEVSLILGCTVDTVKYHVKNIYKKLEVNSKALAITKAVRLGLITLERIDL